MKNTFTILIIFFTLQLVAQNTWTGGGSSNKWNDAGNWSYGYIPVATEDVFINLDAKVAIPSNYHAECKLITMSVYNSPFQDSLIISPNASLTLGNGGNFNYLWNQGELLISDNSLSPIYFNGPIINDGKIHNKSPVNTTWFNDDDEGIINNDSIIASVITIGSNDFVNNGIIEIPTEFHPTSDFPGLRVNPSTNVAYTGKLTNYGKITKTGPQQAILNHSLIINETSGIIEINETIDNYGHYEIENESTSNDCIFTNKGTLLVNNSNASGFYGINVSGADAVFNNTSTGLVTTGERLVHPIFVEQGGNFNNAGTLNIIEASNGQMIAGSATFTNVGGKIEGDGNISISNFTNNGILAPGQSPGKITRVGDSNLGSALYRCELAGTAGAGVGGGNDLFEVTDNLNLGGGQLSILLINGFTPSLGDVFTIATATNSLTSTFGTVNTPSLPSGLFWHINYNSNSVTLEITNGLPIELSHFTVEKNNDRHDLKWTTASEQNSSHFEIEYSIDGTEWKNIGVVEASGESNSENQYSMPNFYPSRFVEVHYYRLKMVDLDATFEYSNIVSVTEKGNNSFSIFPNPTKNLLNIHGFKKGNFQLFDQVGRLVKSGFLEENTTIDLSNIEKGIYFLKAQSIESSFSEKIIIK